MKTIKKKLWVLQDVNGRWSTDPSHWTYGMPLLWPTKKAAMLDAKAAGDGETPIKVTVTVERAG